MKFGNEYLLDYLYNFEIDTHSLDAFNWLPSVRYRNIIAEATKDLKTTIGHAFIFPALVSQNHQLLCYICNNPIHSIAYSATMMHIVDPYFKLAVECKNDFFAPKIHYPKHDKLLQKTLDIYANKFMLHDSFALVRRCEDLAVVIGVANAEPVTDIQGLYDQYQHQIEEVAIYLISYFKDLYIEQHPGLRFTRFMNDAEYRREVIKGKHDSSTFDASRITARERECLYWISKGKTSREAAEIMNISTHTINEHKKSIAKKMKTNNMSQSIYMAVKHQLIV